MSKKDENIKSKLLHAIYARDIVLPGENKEDFDALLEGLTLEFQPRGQLQADTVCELAMLQMCRVRAARFALTQLMRTRFVQAVSATQKKSPRGVARALEEQSTGRIDIDASLQRLASKATELTEKLEPSPWRGRVVAHAEEVVENVEEVRTILNSVKSALDINESEALDAIERLNRIERELDAQVEKKIRRLVMLKEYDRMYGGQSIRLVENKASQSATRTEKIDRFAHLIKKVDASKQTETRR